MTLPKSPGGRGGGAGNSVSIVASEPYGDLADTPTDFEMQSLPRLGRERTSEDGKSVINDATPYAYELHADEPPKDNIVRIRVDVRTDVESAEMYEVPRP